MAKYYLDIRDKKIPVIIRNYKNSKNVKLFFTEATLNISKPKYVTYNQIEKFINKNKDKIYQTYTDFLYNKDNGIKKWETGNSFPYLDEQYKIQIVKTHNNITNIEFLHKVKTIKIVIPDSIPKDIQKEHIDKHIKKALKIETIELLKTKLPYWSQKTNIQYNSFIVRDAVRKYGSCIPTLKKLTFNGRLIMLPNEKIDAIIVHELCHISYPNHSKDFYNLVKEHIYNYNEINKWLKQNYKLLYI